QHPLWADGAEESHHLGEPSIQAELHAGARAVSRWGGIGLTEREPTIREQLLDLVQHWSGVLADGQLDAASHRAIPVGRIDAQRPLAIEDPGQPASVARLLALPRSTKVGDLIAHHEILRLHPAQTHVAVAMLGLRPTTPYQPWVVHAGLDGVTNVSGQSHRGLLGEHVALDDRRPVAASILAATGLRGLLIERHDLLSDLQVAGGAPHHVSTQDGRVRDRKSVV